MLSEFYPQQRNLLVWQWPHPAVTSLPFCLSLLLLCSLVMTSPCLVSFCPATPLELVSFPAMNVQLGKQVTSLPCRRV